MPVYKSRTVLGLIKGLKLFLNLDVELTRGPVPDFEHMLLQAQNRIKQQNRQLGRMRKRLSEKYRTPNRARRRAAGPAKATRLGPLLTPPLPLPPGYSEQRLRELITSVRVEGARVEEFKNYANADLKRFVYTLGFVPEKPQITVLELGANPYFTTTLLHWPDPGFCSRCYESVSTDSTAPIKNIDPNAMVYQAANLVLWHAGTACRFSCYYERWTL